MAKGPTVIEVMRSGYSEFLLLTGIIRNSAPSPLKYDYSFFWTLIDKKCIYEVNAQNRSKNSTHVIRWPITSY